MSVSPLHPTSTATSVRRPHGKPIITDGPFAETREQLGGFFIVEAANLDEAIEIAGKIRQAAGEPSKSALFLDIPGIPEK